MTNIAKQNKAWPRVACVARFFRQQTAPGGAPTKIN